MRIDKQRRSINFEDRGAVLSAAWGTAAGGCWGRWRSPTPWGDIGELAFVF
jgi:hypothetical protein